MDNREFRKRLRAFRNFMGLGEWEPLSSRVVKDRYCIFVSPPDEIANALRNRTHLSAITDEKADSIKEEYESRGFHVYVGESPGCSDGGITEDSLNNRAKFALVYLHESFHANPHCNLAKSIEEASGFLVALEGEIAFFRICGSQEDLKEAYKLRDNQYRRVRRFNTDYQKRIEELAKGKVINPSERKNNAFLFAEALYCMNYPLLRKVYGKIGNIFETYKRIVYLPSNGKRAIAELEAIVNS